MSAPLAAIDRGPGEAGRRGPAGLVVLVHGAGGSAATSFAALVPSLARRHRVLAVDLPGSGDSSCLPAPSGGWDLDAVADALTATVTQARRAEDGPVLLLGHSLGGLTVLRAAARYPGLADDVLLAAVPLDPDPRLRLWTQLWRRLHDLDRDLMARHLLLATASPSWLAGLRDDDVEDLVRLAAELAPAGTPLQLDLAGSGGARADLARLITPPAVLLGDEDPLVRVRPWQELAAQRPGLQLRIRPAGHDVLAHCAAEVADWIAERLGGPAVVDLPVAG